MLFPDELALMWIGLNPSTADENQLDPTLRRIQFFTAKEGYNTFYMTNLFAYRATKPEDMKVQADPVGADNDEWLVEIANKCKAVVFAWGVHGEFQDRQQHVEELLKPFTKLCLGTTKAGCPKHPLYVRGSTPLRLYGA